MTTTAEASVGVAASWRLLSLGFTSPTSTTLGEVELLAEALAEIDPSEGLAGVLHALRDGVVLEDVAGQYAALFRGQVRVAPYEGSYELDPIRQGRQMADVAGFYRAFGAEASGPVAERPDFVGCELEFLSFLELRRIAAEEAGETGREIVSEIRDAFLEEHAGRWLPTFFADVTGAADGAPLYRALAAFGAELLARELARYGLEPSVPPRRGPGSSLDADALECGAAEADLPM